MQRLLLLGLNHTTAPLEVRERLAFDRGQRDEAMATFAARFPGCELVLLSTCNRVELYAARAAHNRPTVADLIEFVARFHGIAPAQFQTHLYHKVERDAVEHLFSVTSSLDSMVLGETQILGQVREAYESAASRSLAGSLLHPLFQRALAVGKQVMHDTPLAEGRVSVASVAVGYARQIFEHFEDKTVLCIGAGKMASLVLQSFASLRPGKLVICNRTADKAAELAERFGGQAAPFEELTENLVAADIAITSTSGAAPILDCSSFPSLLRQRRYRPLFLIDIAVPRAVEASVGDLEHVYLYNLDDLQRVVMNTQSQRQDALAAARQIVVRQVEDFAAWHRQRELGPSIHRLYGRYHEIAQEEVSRTVNKLPNVTQAERAHLEDLARRIVNKLLHDPVQVLRRSEGGHATNTQYLHALEKLFQLSEEGASAPEPPPAPIRPDATTDATP